jgi:hypothetical protein
MARSKQEQELFDMLRARGLRKRVARTFAEAASRADGSVPKPVRDALGDLRSAVSELESRVTGRSGGSSRSTASSRSSASSGSSGSSTSSKRSEAAKKAAQTRKRNASKRSSAAKKAAETRRAKSR